MYFFTTASKALIAHFVCLFCMEITSSYYTTILGGWYSDIIKGLTKALQQDQQILTILFFCNLISFDCIHLYIVVVVVVAAEWIQPLLTDYFNRFIWGVVYQYVKCYCSKSLQISL